ncbi:MAG: DUF805 domain-containing protein [Actinomycetota bacterium]|nr:DUF805 domain-containing protein [Actinomycetota bacterium]
MIFLGGVKLALQNYANFKGRASRSEYWTFAAVLWVTLAVLYLLGSAVHLFLILMYLLWLAVLVPGLSLSIRRLHDTGKSGWLVLLGLIPFVGGIILLVFVLLPGDPVANEYGPPRPSVKELVSFSNS